MNGLKIVFLDLDGVLNTLRWRQKMGKKAIADEYGYSFDPDYELTTGRAYGEWLLRICRDAAEAR